MLSLAATAQQKPGWIYNKPTPTNNSYLYVVEAATGTTEINARNQAFGRVLQSTAMRLGQPFDIEEVNKAVQSGTDFEVISARYNIPINKVCEYTEQITGGYRVYVLCQAAKAGNILVEFDDFNGCREVNQFKNSTALLKSAVVPGLGQMGKRHYVEGALTLISEVALLGGSLGTYLMGQNQLNIMKNVNTGYTEYMEASDKYNQLKTANTILLSAAAAVYVVNLVRAYTVRPRYNKDFAFNPTIFPSNNNLALGMNVTYHF